MHEAVIMRERRYCSRRHIYAANFIIRKKGRSKHKGSTPMVQEGQTLSIYDALALSLQHGGKFVARELHS
jgi:hypothetical protein